MKGCCDAHCQLPVGSLRIEKLSKPSLFVTGYLWLCDTLDGLRYSLKRKSKEEEKFLLDQTELFLKEHEKEEALK